MGTHSIAPETNRWDDCVVSFPKGLLSVSTAAQPSRWPETIVPQCDTGKGSLGSDVLALRGGSPRVLKGMVEALATEFRKSWFDLAGGKVTIYRDLGVLELWELATGAVQRAPRILDLQAEGAARAIPISRIVPGVQAERLPAAVAELKEIGGLVAFVERKALGEPVVEWLLAAAGAPDPSPRRP